MIKYLFIFLNSLGLFLFSLFSGDGGVTITNTIPSSLKPGQEVKVEIKIDKGNMSGFAKMQLELPAGITVNEIDSKGSNFSFIEGTAKWVWASLPAESEIVLKLSLVVGAGVSEKVTIGGKYSFIENNAKKVVDMAPVEVTIGGEGVAATNTTSVQNSADNTSTITTNNNANNPSGNNQNPSGNITLSRSIVKGGAPGEYVVNVAVNKGSTKGFARYSDDLPEGVTAKSLKNEGGSFSVADGKIKFVWVNVPEKDILELSYSLSGVTKATVLSGEYSFLEENQSKKVTLNAETITPDAENTANTTPTNTATSNDNQTADNTATTSANTDNTQAIKETNNNNNNSNTETLTKKEGNINYKVQIGAFTNSAVSAAKLKNKFAISENVQSELAGGYSKFMVGNHGEYKEARNHRVKLKSSTKVTRAFVVAYNTGKRITVQEALMISNQKWFK